MASKLTVFIIVVLCEVFNVSSIGIGESCVTNNEPGTCKTIYDCPYATRLLADYKKPENCFWQGKVRVVCCPTKNLIYKTGAAARFFDGTNDGVLRSRDTTCRYDGVLPITCCQNTLDRPEPKEPEGCPALTLPKMNIDNHNHNVIWQKCKEYQRYVHMCVGDKNDPDVYSRENTCMINKDNNRIVGGVPVGKRETPHMALLGARNLQTPNNSYIVWYGGGTLISDRYILTARHVITHPVHGLVRYALLGVTNKTDVKDGLLYTVVRRIGHRLYESGAGYPKHDIALLELYNRVQLSEHIRPACLPIPGMSLGESLMTTGWGRTGEFDSVSDVLLKTTLQELNYEKDCSRLLDKESFKWDKDTMICAGPLEGQIGDTCEGDSGGPLMVFSKDLDCTYVVVGVTSRGPKCGQAPGIYTKVGFYLNWIVENVWGDE